MKLKEEILNLEYIEYSLYSNNIVVIRSINKKTELTHSLYFDLKSKISSSFINKILYGDLVIKKKYSFLLGILTIEKQNFFIFAEKVKKSGKLRNHNIYEIKNIKCMPFENNNKNSNIVKYKLDILKNHFSKGFYFSFTLNLSNFLDEEIFDCSEFIINNKLNMVFLNKDQHSEWAISVINGFFKTIKMNIKTQIIFLSFFMKIQKLIISIDLFIESDSFLKKYKIIFIDVFDNNYEKYFFKIIKNNFRFLLINFISNNSEKRIICIKILEKLISSFKNKKNYKNNNLKYNYLGGEFDEEVIDFDNFDNFYEISKFFEFSKYDNFLNEISYQKGIFISFFYKVPNLKMCFFILYIIFEKIKEIIEEKNKNINIFDFKQKFSIDINKIFGKIYKNLFLILTDSQKNNFSLKIKKNQKEKKIFYLNKEIFLRTILNSNFHKKEKPRIFKTQLITESFTKEFNIKLNQIEKFDKSFLKLKQNLLSKNFPEKNLSLKILFFSFNLEGSNPEKYSVKLKKIIISILKKKPDIIYFGFQEIDSRKILFKNCKNRKSWMFLLRKELFDYNMMINEGFQNLHSFLFVLKIKKENVLIVDNNKINLGLYKFSKSDAAFSHMIKINKIFLQVTNCKISQGINEKKKKIRIFDIDQIINSNNSHFNYLKPDIKFLLGNFNFSIDKKKFELLNLWKEKKNFYSDIAKFDEINKIRNSLPSFFKFKEETINFGPTSKYDKEIEYIKKDKILSWSDRIFFDKGKGDFFKIFDYNSYEIYMSSYKPVFLLTELFC